MATQTNTKTLSSHTFLHTKPPKPSKHFPSKKLKTLMQAHILPHVCHVAKTLSKAKCMVMELIKWRKGEKEFNFGTSKDTKVIVKKQKNNKKLYATSIRTMFNWRSSHIQPMPEPSGEDEFENSVYYDPTWNSIISMEGGEEVEPQLSGYLQWLEEMVPGGSLVSNELNEIDRLAEMFIAKCHEKFRLEKQESYRRYQEMLARSI